MTRLKVIASLTGISILLGLVMGGTPRALHSYFSSVVRAEVGSFTVVDFQAPELEITLQDGSLVFAGPTGVSEPADPVVLTGSASHTIPLMGQHSMSQVVQATLQFSGEVESYQREPCLTFSLENNVVFAVLCQSVTDTDAQIVFIPVAQLSDGTAQTLHVQSHLPENQSVTLSSVQLSTWFLTNDSQVTVRVVDATQVQITSSVGVFHQDGEQFVLQSDSLPQNQTVLLEFQAVDAHGNTSQVQQLLHRVPLSPQTNHNTVSYFSEPDGSYHALVRQSDLAAWHKPAYLKNNDSSLVSSRHTHGIEWYPVMRYQEPESVITQSKQLQLYDSFLQPYPLIETE